MFSSNQVLTISGKMEQLGSALAFALDYSGFSELIDDPERKTHIVYQIAQDGCFCIGYAFDEPKEGWEEFQFGFDRTIVASVIERHIDSLPVEKPDWGDGGYRKGFLMQAISESMASERDGIKRPFYGIVSFRPYYAFYSK